jgi:glycosyltransferase involved in cell wall biosynthesis
MKILYDHQIFSLQRHGGISRYFSELALRNNADVAVLATENEHLSAMPFYRCMTLDGSRRIPGKTTLIKSINAGYARIKLAGSNFDVFHPTYYHPYFRRYLGKRPYVLTVYDMVHEVHPNCFSHNDRTAAWKRTVISHASRIIAISEFTRQELMRLYGLDGTNIDVVHLASSFRSRGETASEGASSLGGYILYVGTRSRYKNFDLFIHAMAPLLKRDPDLRIVCAGGGDFDSGELAVIESLQLSGRLQQLRASDEELAKLYAGAKVFVFPSLYEGFGIPVLEAFSCGCPVIVSNAGSLPEVAGNSGIVVDASDESALRKSVEQVLNDHEFRETLIEKGYNRAAQFSWDRVASETFRVYESTL